MLFGHERLRVYERAIEFVAWVEELIEGITRKAAVIDHLEHSADSIALSIPEGNGRSTPADRCRFFDIARGSAFECAACLDVLVARKRVSPDRVRPGKEMLVEIVSMLVGLMKSNSPERFGVPTGDRDDTADAGS